MDAVDCSELVTKRKLNVPRAVDYGVTTPAGHTEILISRPAVNAGKGMPVEGVRDIRLEHNVLPLPNTGSFDDGKIFVHVAGTSPPGDGRGKTPKNIASPEGYGSGARIHKSSTIDCLWRRRSPGNEQSVDFIASAVPTMIQCRGPFRSVREKDVLSGN